MKTEQHWQDVFQAVMKYTDVVLEILDARNPIATHNHVIEKFIEQNKPSVEIILVLNKSDLIPKEILDEWMQYFKIKRYKIYSTSAKHRKGTMFLFHRLRELGNKGNQNILIVGYPNTGKSTLIQALTKNRKKVGVSSSAGFTRAIKKIKLTNEIYLIDTPGVIPIDETNETEIAIKACMVADKVKDPLAVVEAIYKLLPRSQFERVYNIKTDTSDGIEELIEKIGKKHGPLKSGGKVNDVEVQKRIIRDWQSNKLHYFTYPPGYKKKINLFDKKTDKIKERSQPGIPKSIKKYR